MGLEALDEMIRRARENYGMAPAALAREAAPAIDEAVKATAAAGTTPDGAAWEPKKDGGRALTNAAKALKTRADGALVVVTLSGPEVFHDRGGRVPKRQILPDGGAGIPANVRAGIKKALDALFAGGR